MTETPETEAKPEAKTEGQPQAGPEQALTDLRAEMEALAVILPGANLIAAAVAAMVPVPPADDEEIEAGFDNLPV